MGLIQTGSTLQHVPGQGLVGVGDMELIYGCDGCESKTGNPYEHLIKVIVARDGTVVDDSNAEGWEFFHDESHSSCTRSYCPQCARSSSRVEVRQ